MPSDYDTYATLEMDKEGKEGSMVGKLRVSTILERPINMLIGLLSPDEGEREEGEGGGEIEKRERERERENHAQFCDVHTHPLLQLPNSQW